ncbi:MAG: hypothetical protein H6867_09025 [Rhodospirillales bacterium]|nr:hypothetical protein [Rhodospirillales bacterium]MCB9996052.1 hypothetical protein [Rhodospirillales bacterium]
MSTQGDPQADQQGTIFILYIPGGAMLGINPALAMAHLEDLTETPVQELFQVVEGVSTGSILASAFNMPGITASKVVETFVERGPEFFPYIPGRWAKMHARNGINTAKYFYDLDPRQSDCFDIRNIEALCDRMKDKNQTADPELIDQLKDQATQRWLTVKRQEKILSIGEEICKQDPSLEKYRDAITELVSTRTFTSRLSIIFNTPVVAIMDGIKNKWAKMEECLYPSDVPEAVFKELYGERKISDSICSTFISFYDIINNRIVTSSCLKNDLFDKTPGAPATVQNDLKFWDATMASSANELAFKAHITETNILCSDKAPLHRIQSVSDVHAAAPKGTKIILVIAGTGQHIGKDLQEFLDNKTIDDEGLSEHERIRKKLEFIRDQRAEFGMAGNLIMGRELSELEGYAHSDALSACKNLIGNDNVFDFTPRLSPHTKQERDEFPSRDVLDASEDNIKKIIKRGRQNCKRHDDQIRELAQMMVDNLHMLGKMDNDKYARVCQKIGLKTFTREEAIEPGVENRIASNDNSTGARRVWRQFVKAVNGRWGSPPAPRGPKGPSGPGGKGPL